MATMKRRVIYMSDEDWAEATEQAGSQTISAYLRGLIDGERRVPRLMAYSTNDGVRVNELRDPRATMTQKERDALLRKINRS